MKTKDILKRASALLMSLLLAAAYFAPAVYADETSRVTGINGTAGEGGNSADGSSGSTTGGSSSSGAGGSSWSVSGDTASGDTSGDVSGSGSTSGIDDGSGAQTTIYDIIEKEDRTAVKNPDGAYITGLCDVWQHDMSNPSGFSARAYGGDCSVKAVSALGYAPYSVLEGDSSLYAVCNGYREATSFELDYAVNHTIDLSGAKYFTAGIWIADNIPQSYSDYSKEVLAGAGEDDGSSGGSSVYGAGSDISYTVTLTLTASGGSFAETKEIKSGDWYSLFFDISDTRGLSDVHYISISVKRFGSSDIPLIFAVDCLGAASSENALFAAHYLSSGFSASESTGLSQGGELLTIHPTGENPYIQTEDTVSVGLDSGKALRIRLGGNDSAGKALSFKNATLFYTTITSPDFSEDLSVNAEVISDGIISYCIFPVPESVITGFRIYINGTYDSDIAVLSIDICPGFRQTRQIGNISECIISEDGQSISVKGSLLSKYSELYKDSKLYLYALEPYESAFDISIRSVAAAETDLVGPEFSFVLPSSGNINLLFKKYLVMIYYQGNLIQVASPIYITNPSVLAESAKPLELPERIKGSSVSQGSFPVSGQKYTAFQIRLEKLVSQNPSQISYVYGGRSFYFDRDYVSELDSFARECVNNDQIAFFVLTVSRNGSSVSKLLSHPSGDEIPDGAGGEYCALNTETADGILYIRAICDFLASRYAAGGIYSCAAGFVLGADIQNAAENYSMGSVSLSDYAESVSDALHIIYSAISLRSPGTAVYLSVGTDWNRDILPDAKYVFDSRSVLDAVSSAIRQSGDFDWKLAYDPYPEDGSLPVFTSMSADVRSSTFESSQISFSNLELLVSYLSQSGLRFEGEQRDIILLEKLGKKDVVSADAKNKSASDSSVASAGDENQTETAGDSSTDESNAAAVYEEYQKASSCDYIFAYCKLTGTGFAGISVFIVSHDVSYIDTYSLIDTTMFGEISKYALNLMHVSDISEIIPGFDQSKMQLRTVISSAIESSSPSGIKGSAVLFSFADGSDGFSEGSFCSSITSGGSPSGKHGVLGVQFEDAGANRYMSVINRLGYKLDLSGISCLKLEVQPTSLPSSVSEILLTAVISSGDNAVYASGYIKAGVWNTVYINLGGISELGMCDSIKLMISSDSSLGEPELLVDTFYAMSDSHSDQSLQSMIEAMKKSKDSSTKKNVSSDTVKLLCLLILSAVTLEVLNIMIRHRGTDSDESAKPQ